MTTKRKHHREQSVRVDLVKQRVYLGHAIDHWEDLDDGWRKETRYWSRVSTKHCKKDLKEVPFVPEEKRDHDRHDWSDALRPLDTRKRDHRHLVRKLLHHVKREERNAQRHETERLDELRDAVLATEAINYPAPDSRSASGDSSEPIVTAGKPIKDNKHGVQLFSNNGKFFFRIAVYKSKKYPGCSSVYLTVAGRRYLYTLDKTNMEALREEAAKGAV